MELAGKSHKVLLRRSHDPHDCQSAGSLQR
jgi:hypothetical protein